MEKQLHSKYLLNDVLRNINQDIVILRKDFKKLNELVIVLSVKIEETKSIKSELSIVLAKIDSITDKIIDLEKAKERLETVIVQMDKDTKQADKQLNSDTNKKIVFLDSKISDISTNIPLLKKILLLLFALIGIIVYITHSTEKFLEVCWEIIKKVFSFL